MLIFCYIPQYASIFILFTSTEKEMKGKTITERSNDKDEEFIQLTGMVKDETKSDFALTKKKMSRFIDGIIRHGSKY